MTSKFISKLEADADKQTRKCLEITGHNQQCRGCLGSLISPNKFSQIKSRQ